MRGHAIKAVEIAKFQKDNKTFQVEEFRGNTLIATEAISDNF